MKRVQIAAIICMIGTATLGGLATAADNARPLVTITGADSHVKQRNYHRVASEDEWVNVWQQHKGAKESKDYDLFYNTLDLPYINFEKCMVIAVFQGSGWNSAGLKVLAIQDETDLMVLKFRDKPYQTWGPNPNGGAQQVTVYGFFVLPRSSKTVVLEEDVNYLKGNPPVWKERASLSK